MMKLLLALLALLSPAVSHAKQPRLVVRINCAGGVGTGTRFTPDKLITAAHVATVGGCMVDGQPTTMIYLDRSLDVAVLQVSPGPVFYTLDCRPLKAGRKYRATGFADGAPIPMFQDIVWTGDRFKGPDFTGLSIFSGYARPGMSGGPIARKGRISAIVNTYRSDGARYMMGRAMVDTLLCGASA